VLVPAFLSSMLPILFSLVIIIVEDSVGCLFSSFFFIEASLTIPTLAISARGPPLWDPPLFPSPLFLPTIYLATLRRAQALVSLFFEVSN